MHPFLLIMTLLLVFTFFTIKEVKHYINESYLDKGWNSLQEKSDSLQKIKKMAILEDLKAATHDKNDYVVEKKKENPPKEKKERKKKSYKLNFDLMRPPNNSRFNLCLFLFEDDTSRQGIFENLLFRLYKDAPFFTKIPELEKIITQKLLLEKEQFKDAKSPDVISSLSFEDDAIRLAFYQMLKGSETYPSLLNYLTFDKDVNRNSAKINLLFSAKPLLFSLLNNDKLSERIFLLREELMNQIVQPNTPLTREVIQEQLKERFVAILMEENLPIEPYKKLFDFSLGKMGTILFLEDPFTHQLTRERLH